jgi:RNA polymerase sigma-70 factor (ECF subfamily)
MGTIDGNRLLSAILPRASALTLYARQWLDAAAAEDVVQEALTVLLTQSRTPDEPLAWMYRAVRNAAIDTARAAVRRKRREQTVAAARTEWFDASAEGLLDARTAEAALCTLAPQHREIVLMRIWGDLPFSQIAGILDLSVSTVHARYTTALAELRKKLENSCPTK